jgi:hypothetical protein
MAFVAAVDVPPFSTSLRESCPSEPLLGGAAVWFTAVFRITDTVPRYCTGAAEWVPVTVPKVSVLLGK